MSEKMEQIYYSIGETLDPEVCKILQKNRRKLQKHRRNQLTSPSKKINEKSKFVDFDVEAKVNGVVDTDGLDIGVGVAGHGNFSWAALRSFLFFWNRWKVKGSDTAF
jgi:hypothetical protein